MKKITTIKFALLAIFAGLLLTVSAQAATYTVDSILDPGDGICDAAECTLREAITAANATADNDIINFDRSLAGQTITLNGTELIIANNGKLTINGLGADQLSVSGKDASRVFLINPGANATIKGITVTDGNENNGGGINNNGGTTTLNNSTVSGNSASNYGGGIFTGNGGTTTLNDSTVSDNSASNFGGGISNNGGTTTLTNSTVSDNSANFGGGIFNNGGTTTLTNSTVSGNSVTTGGGGIYNLSGTFSLTNSTVSGNSATSSGGGITNSGTFSLTNSTVSGNSAIVSGGGIRNESGGTTTLTNSTVSNNSATSGGGGGIFNNSGTTTLTNSTVSGNSANGSGGGISNNNTLSLTNSTVSGNSANFGGGINNNSSDTLTLNNSTVSDNSAIGGGGINNNGTTTLNNSIIANSTSGGDCLSSGTVNASFSLIEDGLTCVNGTNSNNLTGDPMLGPLQNNGGQTETHALLAGSIAIDAGSNALIPTGVTTDQRGQARIVDGDSNGSAIVDIGSFEALAPTAASVSWRAKSERRTAKA